MKPINLPKVGLTMEEAKIIEWFKREGESVKAGETLLEIETEKANSEIVSPVNGYLKSIVVRAGETVSVESTLAYIAETEEELKADFVPAQTASQSRAERTQGRIEVTDAVTNATGDIGREIISVKSPDSSMEVRAAPAARRLARDLGVDLKLVLGTGPGGRILPEDVRQISNKQKEREHTPQEPEQRAAAQPNRIWESRRAARTLLNKSLKTIPHINIAREIRAEHLVKLKEAQEGFTYTGILVKVLAQALTEFEEFQQIIVDDKLNYINSINVGLVIDTENGLRIPVLKNVNQKNIQTISEEIKALSVKARQNRLMHTEVHGAAVSVSNLGMNGVDFFTAIIPYGQTAILTVGRIRNRLIKDADRLVEVPFFWVNLVVDHRLIDGRLAARLVGKMAAYLESELLREFSSPPV